ncbi:MAG TPA: histidine kinase [Solirubrobacteraceae bacterium]|nr:histidine kinase [Solirubrobacteraceae bacterium]
MTPVRSHDNLLFMNIAATLRSEPVRQFLESARDGLALTFVGRGEPRPPLGRRREQLITIVAILGAALIGLALLTVALRRGGEGRGNELAAVYLGLLLVAARFRLTAWRLGLFISLAVGVVGQNERAVTAEFVVLVALFCAAAPIVQRSVLWWMCGLMLAVLWIAMPAQAGTSALGVAGLIVAAAVAMDAIRGWRQTREALEVETEHAEQEQARRAVLEERARIGRELHDVVAHHMSLIAVQAETAPYRVGEISESVSGEFTAISAAARAALGEMRRLLSVLRNDEEATRTPQPQIDEIHEMVATARNAGMTVDYTPAGTLEAVPQSIGLCAYRIVQEALTNASRHAPGSAVTVRLVRNEDALRLEVVNGPGRTAVPADADAGLGQGLAGMRERASLLGGALTAGATTDGGFAVTAVLPIDGD